MVKHVRQGPSGHPRRVPFCMDSYPAVYSTEPCFRCNVNFSLIAASATVQLRLRLSDAQKCRAWRGSLARDK